MNNVEINMTETPEAMEWPETHYVYVEKQGPFHQTARECWTELMTALPNFLSNNELAIKSRFATFKLQPDQIYRAGISLNTTPKDLSPGFEYCRLEGGKYVKFVLTGSYMGLPQAYTRALEIIQEQKITIREAFYIEHYVNDMSITPENELVTHIMIPVH